MIPRSLRASRNIYAYCGKLTITGIHPDYGMYEGRIPLIVGETVSAMHPANRYWGLGAYAGWSRVFFDRFPLIAS